MIKKVFLLQVFITYVLLSGLIIAFLYNIFEVGNFYLIKDISVFLMIMSIFVLYAKKFNLKFLYYILGVAFVVILGVILSKSSLFLIIASIRQFVIPFLFIMIGYYFIKSKDDLVLIIRFSILLLTLIVIFGFFENIINLWSYVDVSNFYDFKKIPLFSYGYPVFWIEPISIFGYRTFENGMPRMVSTILDPINLGNLLVFGFTLLFFEGRAFLKQRLWFFLLVFFFVALMFTFSKGAWLQLMLVFFVFNTNVSFAWKILFSFISLPVIYMFIVNHAGFMIHFLGFIGVFEYISFFGSGLGSFGNYSSMYSDNSVEGVGDSYWATVIGQFGIFGFFIWIFTFILISSKIGFKHYISWLLMAQVLVSALSENAFNFMSVFLLMIFVGGYLRIKNREKGSIK